MCMRYFPGVGIWCLALLMSLPVCGQRKPKIKGNRSVITVEKPLGAFSHLKVTDGLEVRLHSGDSEGVRIEADDNLIDILRFRQDGDTLIASTFYTITGSKKLDLTLTYQDLNSIEVEQGSVVSDQTISADQLELVLLDGGHADLSVRAALVRLRMEGDAATKLNISADSLRADLAEQSDAFIYSSDAAMDLSLSGRAAATLEGTGTTLMLSMTDNATLKAAGLEARSATAFMNASSQAYVRALSELAYEGREKSRLYIYGAPAIQILGFFDTAELHKASD